MKLKLAADRPRLDAVVNEILARRPDLEATIQEGPMGGLGFPVWTSVIFTAQHGSQKGLVAAVEYELQRSGVANRLEPA